MSSWRASDASTVRACIATIWLGDEPTPMRLGAVTLRDHQRDAAARLHRALVRVGGALLADDVGLGKTYTALAATRTVDRLLVVGPASLRSMWRQALQAAQRQATYLSFESLSRADATRSASRRRADPVATTRYDVVIIDEAHHARNPATRRYQRLASIATGSRVLLLSATPVHNATRDLHALLALFLGSRAERMAPGELGECLVRRTRADVPITGTPTRAPPTWLRGPGDGTVLQALLDIPPPCPPRDGTEANALVALGLVRAWSSTDAALRVVLRRRLARAESLTDALAAGRHPSRAELRSWVVGDDATQLAFPELVTTTTSSMDAAGLLSAVRAHTGGVRAALRAVDAAEGRADDTRRDLLRQIRGRHPDQPIVVFSQFAESVHAMFKRLVGDGGVCAITARGALVAGGPLSRRDALARFAPRALGAKPARASDVIAVLIATDLLSEGLNLQDAGVAVHLDLPWTPARLAQRMGRIWRIGSRHAHVFEYVIAPPQPAERASRIIARLERKAIAARHALGDELTPLLEPHALESLPGRVTDATHHGSPPEHAGNVPRAVEGIRRTLAGWRGTSGGVRRDPCSSNAVPPNSDWATMVAVARSAIDGWLAVIAAGSQVILVARRGEDSATADPAAVLAVVKAASGPACEADPACVHRVYREAHRYLAFMKGANDAGLDVTGSPAHARLSTRIAELVAAAPPHRRTVVTSLAAAARDAIGRVRSVGGERALARVAAVGPASDSSQSAEAWLKQVAASAHDQSVATAKEISAAAEEFVPAILLLVAERG